MPSSLKIALTGLVLLLAWPCLDNQCPGLWCLSPVGVADKFVTIKNSPLLHRLELPDVQEIEMLYALPKYLDIHDEVESKFTEIQNWVWICCAAATFSLGTDTDKLYASICETSIFSCIPLHGCSELPHELTQSLLWVLRSLITPLPIFHCIK